MTAENIARELHGRRGYTTLGIPEAVALARVWRARGGAIG